jgi:hypothetical protein
MASERAYAHPRLNANAEGPAKKEVGYSSAMLADGTTAVRSVPRGIRHFPPATTAIQRVHDLVRPGKTSDLSTTSALGLGCVKTRRRSIAIEEVIRLKLF